MREETCWIEEEFNEIEFGDVRLIKRFKNIFKNFMKQAQSSIASCFDKWSDIKASYRFFDNQKVRSDIIIEQHIASSVKNRIAPSKANILVLHDTTYIDYKNRVKNTSLDKVFSTGKDREGSLGLILHSSLAVEETGIPLGILHQNFIKRATILHPKRNMKTKAYVHTKPIKEKESYKWIESIESINNLGIKDKELVHVADREADFYELYRYCDNTNTKVVVRAKENRTINKKKEDQNPSINCLTILQHYLQRVQ